MSGKLNQETFIGTSTPKLFRSFMGYGSEIYLRWIDVLRKEEKDNIDSLKGFSPQECILYESNYRTLGFLYMCKEYIKDIDKQSLNSAIDRYNTICEHSREIVGIILEKSLADRCIGEKRAAIINYLIRSNEILYDATYDIKKAIG